ncbi:PLDc N-terminal domain-containing protein [Limibaculum sp. FT325]|uniref:PLDc N-terminal domain-containing protein n=1 Tax=Thermohalobaculum sediminis TaxID=2939436 RepID=UPI0020C0C4CF|nr:PLDc N-terminal domain-containing protein [Limibaculum sediminis]MCL5776335.1 PLDc N-terminal domain-containing protein [Limibaculum sediminis]
MELGLLGLIQLALVIYAVLKIAGSAAGTGVKVVWILVVIVFPLIGFIVWLIFGPR